jgi:hypothetical protein
VIISLHGRSKLLIPSLTYYLDRLNVGKGEGYGEVMEELRRREYLREEQFYCLLIVYLVFASYLLYLQMTTSPLFIAFKGEF